MRWKLRPDRSSSSALVARRNSRSGARPKLEPPSATSSRRFLSVKGTARFYGGLPGALGLLYLRLQARVPTHMDFRILGPLEVLEEGRAVALRGSKQRALL